MGTKILLCDLFNVSNREIIVTIMHGYKTWTKQRMFTTVYETRSFDEFLILI